jgi:protein-tyrosine phosphatase
MIDLHAHILPAIDDGPPTTDAALVMARAAVAAGTRAIATTSHVEDMFNVDPDQIAGARDVLATRLADEGIELELLAGGEIGAFRLPALADEQLRALALGGGPYVLLECPLEPTAPPMDVLVDDLHERGFEVLLAHPERSPSFQRDPELLAGLVEQGALAQVTAGALTGQFGGLPQRTAKAMIRDGLAHVLASDAHDAVLRPPALDADGLLAPAEHEWMTSTVPEAIVTGTPVPVRSWSTR